MDFKLVELVYNTTYIKIPNCIMVQKILKKDNRLYKPLTILSCGIC